jgi:hypothetical protein
MALISKKGSRIGNILHTSSHEYPRPGGSRTAWHVRFVSNVFILTFEYILLSYIDEQ